MTKKRPAKKATNWVDKRAMNNIWITPPEEIDRVHRYAPIGLDPCTEIDNPARAASFFTEADDGLAQSWRGYGLIFLNAPYSLTPRERKAGEKEPPLRKWVRKLHAEVQGGDPAIALLPCGARFSTGYWQENVLVPELTAVCFVRGRIKFLHGKRRKPGKGNNYDSIYYGFNVDVERFGAAFKERGSVFALKFHRYGMLDGLI